jgi:hypothetical protein
VLGCTTKEVRGKYQLMENREGEKSMSQASIPLKGTANESAARGRLPKNKNKSQLTPCFRYAFQSWKSKGLREISSVVL